MAGRSAVRLVREPAIETFLRETFRGTGLHIPLSNLQQADVPEGGRRSLLPNEGTAPGLARLPGGKRTCT